MPFTLLGATVVGLAVSAASSLLSPEAAQKHGWAVRPDVGPRYAPTWFARNYAISAPVVAHQRLAASAANIDLHSLRAGSPEDRQRLWVGLSRDLAPNQSLFRKGDELIWVAAGAEEDRSRVQQIIAPQEVAPPPGDLAWIAGESVPAARGLAGAYAAFLVDISDFDRRLGPCCSVRAVYTSQGFVSGYGGVKGLAAAAFWVPRSGTDLSRLVERMEQVKAVDQVVLQGKGLAIVLTLRTAEAADLLLQHFGARGYRVHSRVPSYPRRRLGPSAPPSDPPVQ